MAERICSVAYGEQSARARSRREMQMNRKNKAGMHIGNIYNFPSLGRTVAAAHLNAMQPNEFRAQTSMNTAPSVPILSIVIVVRGTISKANLLDIKRAGIYM
jgi:hypothetical protein